MKEFERLVNTIIETQFKVSPISATAYGVHKYDCEMDNVERDVLKDTINKIKIHLENLRNLNLMTMSNDEYIDWRLLKNNLELQIREFEEHCEWERNPAIYTHMSVMSVFLLSQREFAPIHKRAESIISRMQKVPKFLRAAKRNLKNTPRIYVKLAIEEARNGVMFIRAMVEQLRQIVPRLERRLEKASQAMCAALEDYARYLEKYRLLKATRSFAIGKSLFNYKLLKEHTLPYTADEILSIGYETKRATEKELMKMARRIHRSKPWWVQVEELKNFHPQPRELEAAYQSAMTAAKRFVREKNVVTIPRGEDLEVIETPLFFRPALPYAAYMPPGPFDKQQKGFFFVTPVDDRMPKKLKAEMLRGHSIYTIPIIALHEGYPGHHLQYVHANRVKSKTRKFLTTTVFAEGWALYCEEMMHRLGFYKSPKILLMKQKAQLWRACRVIIDVSIHTGKMTFKQAVDLLVNDAKIEKVHAVKEVTRYTYSPTQPLSYMIGKKQILELHDDYKKKHGRKFVLKKFHDALLQFGSIPISLIREAFNL
jgi:uncharacterized protein (DUF885 family)